jgi:MSHA biogenesis protein MshI
VSVLQRLFSRASRSTTPDRSFRPGAGAWLGIYASESALLGAVTAPSRDKRPAVRLLPAFPVPARAEALGRWREALPKRTRANVVLRRNDYRVLPFEPPEMPLEEQREAVRWQIADALDFSAEDAAIDLLTVPSQQGGQAQAGGPSRQRFVIAAANETIVRWVGTAKEADLTLGAIDIPEMAMRNLSVLAAGDAPHAFLHVGIRSTRMVIVWRKELCSFRQLELAGQALAGAGPEEIGPFIERLALEVQRSADSFTRQCSGLELETLWLSSIVEPERLADELSLHIAQQVRVFELAQHVDVIDNGSVLDLALGQDHLLAIGAALRQEEAPRDAA